MPTQFNKVQSTDRVLQQVQTNVEAAVNPLVKSPANNSSILKSQVLVAGVNTIPHLLGRKLQGWGIVRVHNSNTVQPTGWIPVTNYGSHYGAYNVVTSPGYVTPSYMMDGKGWVYLTGLIASTTTVALGTTLFTLPAGFTPGNPGISTTGPIFCGFGSWDGTAVVFRIDVYQSGAVVLLSQTGSGASAPQAVGFVSIEGISFPSINAAPTPTFSDTQDSNPNPNTMLQIVASAPCTVDIEVF